MKHKFLAFAFVVQFALITLVFFNAYLPVLFGDEVKVRARGYDPRDILAGNFVRLDYGISVKEGELPDTQGREIKEFFVMLVDENNDGVFEFGAKSFDEPKEGLYVKAKRFRLWYEFQIGAEKYFAPKEKALEIERKLRNLPSSASERNTSEIALSGEVDVEPLLENENGDFGALVTLKIYKGKARIVNLEIIEDTKNSNLQGKADELEPLTGGLCTQIGRMNLQDEIIVEIDDSSNKCKENNNSLPF